MQFINSNHELDTFDSYATMMKHRKKYKLSSAKIELYLSYAKNICIEF